MEDRPFVLEDWHIWLLSRVKKESIVNRFVQWWSPRKLLVAVLLLVLGGWFWLQKLEWADLSPNMFSELFGIVVTVLLIDTLNERRAQQELKKQLIREMCSTDNGIALRALDEFKAHGWATDGSLAGVVLVQGNLQKALLSEANLQYAALGKVNFKEAILSKSNFQGALLLRTDFEGANLEHVNFKDAMMSEVNLRNAKHIKDDQLLQARSLRLAIMPDGSIYNGRFNLSGDLATVNTWANIDSSDSKAMADFYGVSVNDYEQGQEWAQKNITKQNTD